MGRINIKGAIIPNDYKWFYDWFEMDCTCPLDVETILNECKKTGEAVDVFINSPGGVIDVGSEIYTMLRSHQGDVQIYITGEACSAASVIAMARYCEMSPTALMMVHCVWTGAQGNRKDFEQVVGMLGTADESIAAAYMAKTGMTKEEALAMMEAETWLTAEQAKEKGMIDAVMFSGGNGMLGKLAASTFALPSAEQMEKAKRMIKEQTVTAEPDQIVELKTAQARLRLLKLGGRNFD